MIARPAIFKWRQTEPGLILCAVRWYLRYSLSLRDVEELLEERGLNVDHTTVWRWVQYYGPELTCRGHGTLGEDDAIWKRNTDFAIWYWYLAAANWIAASVCCNCAWLNSTIELKPRL